jgi:uncharacterized damage-inducible protein DinB
MLLRDVTEEEKTMMKPGAWLAVAVGAMFALGVAASHAGAPGSPGQSATAAAAANPVSTTVKGQLPRSEKNMVGAAEAMPADKYGYKPAPEMNSFGHLVMHSAQSNNLLCSKLSGMAAPEVKIADTDGKEKLVDALKASFQYCSAALANVDDSKLGEPLVLFGNRPGTHAAALIALSNGWSDHYGAMATYLRLNGILPPSAQARKEKD